MVVNSDAAPFVAKEKTMLSASEIKAFEKGAAVDGRGRIEEGPGWVRVIFQTG